MSPRSSQALSPASPLTAVRGIGPVRAERLVSAGFRSVLDLLQVLPFRYEDRRILSTLSSLEQEGPVSLRGRLSGLSTVRVRRRRLNLVRGRLTSREGEVGVIWFNRPYVRSQVQEDVEYLVHGQLRRRQSSWEVVNPSIERADTARLAGRIVPVYPTSGGLAPATIRNFLSSILDSLDFDAVEETLPRWLRQRRGLPPLGSSLQALHRPAASADIDLLNRRATPEHHRLIYGELLGLQIEIALARRHVVRQRKGHGYQGAEAALAWLQGVLPFTMTDSQQHVIREIKEDLESPYPMMRLLQGDVGCGKTVVAAAALAIAAESGLQAALMAPTELLAEQQFAALNRLLGERYSVAILTGSSEGARETRKRLRRGGVQITIGTHALIQEKVNFDDLGLVIVDEQHRFGVTQRRDLQLKGHLPDLLVMTATPIPRSLTLTLYGDLAVSKIDEMPPGRSEVLTEVVASRERSRVYDWLEGQLEEGARAYVVLPLIDESESIEAESIEGLGEWVAERLSRFRCAILHGRTDAEERARLMSAFATGEISVLIATTLIEVGIDVPEATAMIIESSQRFGLSQLHQLRGRVGRGDRQSHCFAIHDSGKEMGRRRLEAFRQTSDGFRIAEMDLELRGPGDVLGTRQSGIPSFRVADLLRDQEWVERARHDARELMERSGQESERLIDALGLARRRGPLTGA